MKGKFNINKIINNDKFVKIFSVLAAIGCWIFVSVVIDPTVTSSVSNIPVFINVQNSSLASLGLDVTKGQDQKITASVEGNRYVIGKLSPDDFVATVNFSKVIEPGEYELEVHISQKIENSDYKILAFRPKTLKFSFDRKISKEYNIEVEAPNLKVKDGYIMEKAYTTSETIKVAGPNKSIEKIAKVLIKTNASDTLEKTFVTSGIIEYYDKDNNLLALDDVTTQPGKFDITVPVYKKKVVKFDFDYINIPNGFPLDKLIYTMSNSEIEIAFPTDTNSNLSEVHLGYIDFRKLDIGQSFSFEVILPSGYINVSNISNVEVKFDGSDYKSKTLNVSKFIVVNGPSDYDITVNTKYINNIKVIAPSNLIDGITALDIVSIIDLSEVQVKEGQFSTGLKIHVQNKENSWVIGEYDVIISSKPK